MYILVVLMLLAPAGCSAVSVESSGEGPGTFEHDRSYAWGSAPDEPEAPAAARAAEGAEAVPAPGSDEGDAEVERLVRAQVDAELSALGMQQVPLEGAPLVVTQTLAYSERTQINDPYYSYSVAQVIEEGTLTLTFTDPSSRRVLWEGSGSRRLRTTARTVGLFLPRLAPTNEPRDWDVPGTVQAIMKAFPRGGAVAAP